MFLRREMFSDIIPAPVRNVYIGTAQFAECKGVAKCRTLNALEFVVIFRFVFLIIFILCFFLGGVLQSSCIDSPPPFSLFMFTLAACRLHCVVLPLLCRHCAKRVIYITKHNFVHQFILNREFRQKIVYA